MRLSYFVILKLKYMSNRNNNTKSARPSDDRLIKFNYTKNLHYAVERMKITIKDIDESLYNKKYEALRDKEMWKRLTLIRSNVIQIMNELDHYRTEEVKRITDGKGIVITF